MPGKANMAKRVAAEKRNRQALDMALDGVCLVGKVEKSLGNSGFQVNLGGNRLVQGLIRGVLKGGMKSAAFVSVNSFVFLAESEGSTHNHEILGVVKSRKELKQLESLGRIHASLLESAEEDDIFEQEEEDDPTKDMTEEEATSYLKLKARMGHPDARAVPEPVSKRRAATPEGDDLNIDDI
jgi:hypothetical protein